MITNPVASTNIYLNDRLTKHRQNVLFAARKLVKGKKLFAAWSQGGNILVRKTESSKILQVQDHDDLLKIKIDYGQQSEVTPEDKSPAMSHLSDYDYDFSYASDY